MDQQTDVYNSGILIMPQFCAVVNCGNKSGAVEGVSFYRFPSEKDNSGKHCQLRSKRRKEWIKKLRRENLTESILKNQRVCSRHFITGGLIIIC